jgi:predicted nucleic acid-binding protein
MPIIDAPPETPLLMDTDIFSHLRNRHTYVEEYIRNHFSQTKQFPAITAITVFEANQGIESELLKGENLLNKGISIEQAQMFRLRINELIQKHQVLPFNQKASEIAAYIFPRIPQKDRNKHWRDLFIVSIALAYNYGMASHNRRDIELIAEQLPASHKYLRLAVWKK